MHVKTIIFFKKKLNLDKTNKQRLNKFFVALQVNLRFVKKENFLTLKTFPACNYYTIRAALSR